MTFEKATEDSAAKAKEGKKKDAVSKKTEGAKGRSGIRRFQSLRGNPIIIHTIITTATTITRATTKIIVVIEEMAEAEAKVVVVFTGIAPKSLSTAITSSSSR